MMRWLSVVKQQFAKLLGLVGPAWVHGFIGASRPCMGSNPSLITQLLGIISIGGRLSALRIGGGGSIEKTPAWVNPYNRPLAASTMRQSDQVGLWGHPWLQGLRGSSLASMTLIDYSLILRGYQPTPTDQPSATWVAVIILPVRAQHRTNHVGRVWIVIEHMLE